MLISSDHSVFWSMWFTLACVLSIFLPRFVPQSRLQSLTTIEGDVTIQLRRSKRPLVILIPGTWIFRFRIKRSAWHLKGSEFSQALIKELPKGAIVTPFEWSLANTIEARNTAAIKLCASIRKLNHRRFDRIVLIGHSHGGVVAVQCANLLGNSLRSKTRVCTIATPPYRVTHAASKGSLLSILIALSFVAFTFVAHLLIYRYSSIVEDSLEDRLLRGMVGAGGAAIFVLLLYRTRLLSPDEPADSVTRQNASLVFGTTPHLHIVTSGDGVFNLFQFARLLQQFSWDRMANCFYIVSLLGTAHVAFFYGFGGVKSCVDNGPWWYFTTDRCSTGFEVAAMWIIFLLSIFWGISRIGNLLIGLTPAMTNFAYRIEVMDIGRAANVTTLALDLDGAPFERHSLYKHEEIVNQLAKWITSH